jgi:hypothetical protein
VSANNHSVTLNQVLDHVVEKAQADTVSVGEIMRILGTRAYGPLLLFVSLISMLPPISITPGLPMLTGSLIVILSAQLLLMRRAPWLPGRIVNYSFSRERLMKVVERARPWARRAGKVTRARLAVLFEPPFINVIALICILLGLLSLPLSVLPAGENIPTAGVFFFALALTARDGVLACIGLLISGISVASLIYFWPTIVQGFTWLGQLIGIM